MDFHLSRHAGVQAGVWREIVDFHLDHVLLDAPFFPKSALGQDAHIFHGAVQDQIGHRFNGDIRLLAGFYSFDHRFMDFHFHLHSRQVGQLEDFLLVIYHGAGPDLTVRIPEPLLGVNENAVSGGADRAFTELILEAIEGLLFHGSSRHGSFQVALGFFHGGVAGLFGPVQFARTFRSLCRQLRFLPFAHEILQDFQFRLFVHQIVLFVVDGQLIDPKLLRRAESFLDKLSILLELVLGFLQFFMSQLDVAILLVDIGLVFSGDRSVVKSNVRQAWTHAHWAVREHSCHRQSLDEDAILAQILIPVQLRQVQDQFRVGNFARGLVLLDFQLPFGGLGLAHRGLVGDIPSQEISFELLFVEGDHDLCRFPPKPARPFHFRSLGENGSDLVLKSGPFNLTAGLDGFRAFHVAALGDRDGQIGTLDHGGNLFDTIGAAEFPAQAAANRQ